MQALYEAGLARIQRGNEQADRAADVATRLPDVWVKEELEWHEKYLVAIKGVTIHPGQIRQALKLAAERTRLSDYQEFPNTWFVLETMENQVDLVASASIMQRQEPIMNGAAAVATRMMMGKMPTRERMFKKATENLALRAKGEWYSEKLADQAYGVYSTPHCPFGCENIEDAEHIAAAKGQQRSPKPWKARSYRSCRDTRRRREYTQKER